MSSVIKKAKAIINGAEPLPESMANRAVVRDNAISYRQTYKIPLENIQVRPNFNVRLDYGDIESLALSILNNGQNTPLLGDMDKDGYVYLVDGERRYLAFQWLKNNGYPVKDVEFFINNAKTKEEDRIFSIFTSNDNKKLQPIEVALVFKRLVLLGWTPEEIKNRIGKSIFYVNDHLQIAGTDKDIQQAILDGDITMTSVLKAQKKKMSSKEIKDVIDKSKASGKKVKNKDIDIAVARKKARDLFENPVTYDEIEKVILAWSGYAQHDKKELTELKKDIKVLYES
jgi:ParB family chromosome partitioning protein